MADIKVDTYRLKQYAQRLSSVNSRIGRLDLRLDSLYGKVGLFELGKLIKADALTGYSWKLIKCQMYLTETASDFERLEKQLIDQDPTDFSKPPITGVQELIYDVGAAVKKGAQTVKNKIVGAVQWVADSYVNKGTVYKAVQYGKAVMKAIKGVKKIAAGVGSIVGTGGLATPIAILTIISGMNDVYNSIMDATYTYTEEYDKIGTNALKETMTEAGGIVGEMLGNKEAGENVGEAVYYGSDLLTSIASLQTAYGKVKKLPKVNVGQLKSELKQIGQLDVAKLFNTDVSVLTEQAKTTYKATSALAENTKALMTVADKSFKVGKKIDSIITVGVDHHENLIIEVYDDVSDIKDEVGKGIKVSTKVTKFIFG